jgi:plasmid stability protein
VMTVSIQLSDEQTVALTAKAQARGLSAEQYARQVLEHDLESAPEARPIWEAILDNMEDVPSEAFASLPKDGASQVDHYLYGHPKRNP